MIFRSNRVAENPLPIAVGDFEAQKRFIATHEALLREYHDIRTLLEQVFIRTLAISTEEHPIGQRDAVKLPEEEVEAEDRLLAQPVVFYLGRVAADDFGELLTLAGNGRGVGAYKILRGMYERIVTAAFIAKNPSEARHFLAHEDIERGKLWNRTVEIIPDIKKQFTDEQIQKIETQHRQAQAKLKIEYCNKCNQPITQEAWTRKSLETMAKRADPQLLVSYAYCYLLPTFHTHATSFGLNTRLRKTDAGYTYNELTENEARTAVLLGHGLILRLLRLQNNYFALGLDAEISARFDMFPKVWGTHDGQACSAPR